MEATERMAEDIALCTTVPSSLSQSVKLTLWVAVAVRRHNGAGEDDEGPYMRTRREGDAVVRPPDELWSRIYLITTRPE